MQGDLCVCEWLLARKYTWHEQDTAGVSAVHLVAMCGHTQLLEHILTTCIHGAHRGCSGGAPRKGDRYCEEQEMGSACVAEVFTKDDRASPLHFAAIKGRLDTIKLLLIHRPLYVS